MKAASLSESIPFPEKGDLSRIVSLTQAILSAINYSVDRSLKPEIPLG